MVIQLTLECADTAVEGLVDEMIDDLRRWGMRPNTHDWRDFEACKRFMHARRGRREIAGQVNLGYERCVREIAAWVGV